MIPIILGAALAAAIIFVLHTWSAIDRLVWYREVFARRRTEMYRFLSIDRVSVSSDDGESWRDLRA